MFMSTDVESLPLPLTLPLPVPLLHPRKNTPLSSTDVTFDVNPDDDDDYDNSTATPSSLSLIQSHGIFTRSLQLLVYLPYIRVSFHFKGLSLSYPLLFSLSYPSQVPFERPFSLSSPPFQPCREFPIFPRSITSPILSSVSPLVLIYPLLLHCPHHSFLPALFFYLLSPSISVYLLLSLSISFCILPSISVSFFILLPPSIFYLLYLLLTPSITFHLLLSLLLLRSLHPLAVVLPFSSKPFVAFFSRFRSLLSPKTSAFRIAFLFSQSLSFSSLFFVSHIFPF